MDSVALEPWVMMTGMVFRKFTRRESETDCVRESGIPKRCAGVQTYAALCATLVAGILFMWPLGLSAEDAAATEDGPTGFSVAVALEQVLMRVIAEAEPSVVPIALFRSGGAADSTRVVGGRGFRVADATSIPPLDAVPDVYGTGVVVSSEGLILTNQHVLRGAEKGTRIFIRRPDRPLWDEVRIKATDPYSDLAILEGLSPEFSKRTWRPMPLGDGEKLRKGQIVITLGNPFALARDGEVSAGWGIVSNLRRKLPPARGSAKTPRRPSMHHLGTLIQTDAKLNLWDERRSSVELAGRNDRAHDLAGGHRGSRACCRLCFGG